MTRQLVVAALVASALGLTACSDDDGSAASEADASTSPASSERTAPRDLPTAPALARAKGAVSDLELGECAVEAGEQTVTGTVTSSRRKSGDYVVTISWVNDRSDVRGRAVVVEEDVAPGESREWTASATVADGATSCVPNVRVGRLKR